MVEIGTLVVGDCFKYNNSILIIAKKDIIIGIQKYVKAFEKDCLTSYTFIDFQQVEYVGKGNLNIEFPVFIEEAAKSLKEYLGSTCMIVLIANNTLHVWYKDILNVPQPAVYKGYSVKYYFHNMEEVFTLKV